LTNIGNAEHTDDGVLRPGAAKDDIDYMPPEAAAKVILRGARKEQEFIPVGRVALLASLLMRVSPKLYRRSMWRNLKTEKLDNQLRASRQFDGRMQRRAFDG
jgi:hypothetical protein